MPAVALVLFARVDASGVTTVLPADNPFLLPLPDLTEDIGTLPEELSSILPNNEITPSLTLTPTIELAPIPTPTATP